MSRMFNNYIHGAAKISVDNSKNRLPVEQEYYDEIYIGADIDHNFIIPHVSTDIKDATVYYTQGIETKLIVKSEKMNVEDYCLEKHGGQFCRVSYTITAEESLAFNGYNKNTYAQIKVILNTGEIEYSPKYKIRIFDSNLREVFVNDKQEQPDSSE